MADNDARLSGNMPSCRKKIDECCVAVIGLGYVGMPVAAAFARAGVKVLGYDVDASRIADLKRGYDRTHELESDEFHNLLIDFTDNEEILSAADVFIITVPTPVDQARQPDLTAVIAASRAVARYIRLGSIVVYESTVYPGVTEDICGPVLAKISGLELGIDFHLGYSPERINPGDKIHRLSTVVKVVGAQDLATLDFLAQLYGRIVPAGIHRAPSIKVAEAAKVIENTQRDLNIALMNELSLIFRKLDVDTGDVLAAASTKWNFLPFRPGLVGGHCIGVDPYYLTYKAQSKGYHPEVILAGRRINDGMAENIALECVRLISRSESTTRNVIVLGVTFKENVPDVRNSKVVDLIEVLKSYGVCVYAHDPLASYTDFKHEYDIDLYGFEDLPKADAVILAVPHESYTKLGWNLISSLVNSGGGIVMDISMKLSRDHKPEGISLWRP